MYLHGLDWVSASRGNDLLNLALTRSSSSLIIQSTASLSSAQWRIAIVIPTRLRRVDSGIHVSSIVSHLDVLPISAVSCLLIIEERQCSHLRHECLTKRR